MTDDIKNMRKILINLILGLILLAGAAAVAWQFYGEELRKALWSSKTEEKTEQHAAAPTREVYYCPMHKEYESDKPGNCPICSMKLVKKEVTPGGAPSGQVEQGQTSEIPGMPMPGAPAR